MSGRGTTVSGKEAPVSVVVGCVSRVLGERSSVELISLVVGRVSGMSEAL